MEKLRSLLIFPLACVVAGMLVPTFAVGQGIDPKKDKPRFTEERERGWHWYEVPPKEPEKDKEVKPKQPSGPPPLSLKWLQDKMIEYRDIAIDNPTRENVERYNYVQKLAMDKAEKFALMSQEVNTLNPALDETIQNPVTSYASRAQESIREDSRKKVMQKLSSEVGIYYFFKSDCPYCLKMNGVLQNIQYHYGFKVKAISLDGRGMPDNYFTDWMPDQGQASVLGVVSTPTLYMFKPPNKVVLLSAGLQTVPELTRRMMQVANSNKWLSDDEFQFAMKGLRRDFLLDAAMGEESIDWNDPDSVLKALREISKYGVESATVDETSNTFQATPWIQGDK